MDEAILLKLVEGQARVEQKVTDLSVSLLGGEGRKGAIPFMVDEHDALEARVGVLEAKKNFVAGWIVGVGAIGTALGGALSWLANIWHHAPKGH